MTFQELAATRGTSKRAAITLVRRHGWRRQRDNQNRVIALVPLTWAAQAAGEEAHEAPHSDTHGEPAGQSHVAAFETALAAIEAAHARELATLREQVASAEQARLGMKAMVEQFAGQLRDAGETMKFERARSAAEVEGLRESVARSVALIDGFRSERDQAQQAIAGESARADALRDRLDAAEAQLATAETAAELARRHAHEAQEAADGLRRAYDARKARGLVARLGAAWRGE